MQAIFSLAGKIRGIRVRVCGTKSREKVAGKIRPRGAQGSVELNINSSLCVDKNSHILLVNLLTNIQYKSFKVKAKLGKG